MWPGYILARSPDLWSGDRGLKRVDHGGVIVNF
jgi:hypothetical protein